MDTQRLYQLLGLYAARTASPAEEQELFVLIEDGEERELKAQLSRLQETIGPATDFDQACWQPVLDRILSATPTLGEEPQPIHRILPWARIAAAVIFLVLGAGAWYFIHRQPAAEIADHSATAVRDIAPGGNHAILTLAGGATILLDSAHNGQLASQGNTQIVKLDSGRLTYKIAASGKLSAASEVTYNTIATPRGGFYQLGLPDGTQVWLNAASSLRFPTTFSGELREVEMTGEAYFEIAADKSRPFIVHTRGTRTMVLGTHFNINAYEDEKTLQTTLLQGSVKFSGGGGEALLHPGEQSVFDPSGNQLKIRQADPEAVVAWKNGQFPLKGTDIGTLMRQVARWYNVDVEFEGGMPDRKFGGSIGRNTNLSAVLEALRENGIECRLEGNKIKVLK